MSYFACGDTAMTDLIAVPRRGPYRAVLVLACGHVIPSLGDWNGATWVPSFPFECPEGCGGQPVTDLIVRHG